MKITVEINKIENSKTRGKIHKMKNWFFEKNDKPFPRQNRKKRRRKLLRFGVKKETFLLT